VSPGAVTQLLDLLERQGRIWRQPSKSDRRMSVVTLTATGKRVLVQAQPAVAEATDRALAGLNASEQHQLMRLLQKLEKHVQALSE
jgi:DNA-binding MarR family transcriptional regulator